MDEVSLKKDLNANLLNSTTGRLIDIIIQGNGTDAEREEWERMQNESNNFKKKFLWIKTATPCLSIVPVAAILLVNFLLLIG